MSAMRAPVSVSRSMSAAAVPASLARATSSSFAATISGAPALRASAIARRAVSFSCRVSRRSAAAASLARRAVASTLSCSSFTGPSLERQDAPGRHKTELPVSHLATAVEVALVDHLDPNHLPVGQTGTDPMLAP